MADKNFLEIRRGMMELLFGLTGIAMVVLLGAVSPGPSFLLVARISISQSRRNGIFAAMGMGIGGAVFAMLALLGLKAAFVAFPWLFTGLKILGGTYLLYIGIQIWRGSNRLIHIQTDVCQEKPSGWNSCFTALVTQLSNPKPAVFYGSIFAALLPQSASWQYSIVILFMVFLIEALWYCTVALLLSSSAPQMMYLQSKFWIDRIAGTVMGLLGIKLIVSTDVVV